MDILTGVVQFQVGFIFWRNNACAHLIDFTGVFEEKLNKSADAGRVVAIDAFRQALVGGD
jgi:hypothetical protein